MTLLKFERAGFFIDFERASAYGGVTRHIKTQVSDRTAGNTLQVEELGINYIEKTLDFKLMPHADYLKLRDWFDNIVNGMMKTFIFTDEFGCQFTASFVSPVLEFARINYDSWSGGFTLECYPL